LTALALALLACSRRAPPARAPAHLDAGRPVLRSVPPRDAALARLRTTSAPPDPRYLPAGNGFWCFVVGAGRDAAESCLREREECEVQREALLEIGGQLPRCRPMPTAGCVTYREAGRGSYTCFRPLAQCEDFRRQLITPAREPGEPTPEHDSISDCVEVY
jgi:hypothetical protein